MGNYHITTIDNPFNPHTNYNDWLRYDLQNHNTYGTIARLANQLSGQHEGDDVFDLLCVDLVEGNPIYRFVNEAGEPVPPSMVLGSS